MTTTRWRGALVAAALGLSMVSGCKKTPAGESGAPAPGTAGAKKSPPAEAPPVRITGIPDENPTELARRSAPLVRYLEGQLGRKVSYVAVTDYGAAVQALVAGRTDFAWLGGFTHVQARTQGKVVPLVMRAIDREFKSVFIASAASGITGPGDLKGKTFAFGSKSSTSGHLMPRFFLLRKFELRPGRDFDGEPVFSGAHDATAKMVESGKVAAGALNKEVWERMVREGKVDTKKVRVIWTTPGYVDYVWTARADLPKDLRDRFAESMMALDAGDPAQAEVLSLQGAKRFVPAKPEDFDAIEAVARQTGLLER